MAPTFQSIREDPMEKVIREAFDIFEEDRNGFISGLYHYSRFLSTIWNKKHLPLWDPVVRLRGMIQWLVSNHDIW